MSVHAAGLIISLQWGPVVVTGIRGEIWDYMGAKYGASMGSGRGDRNQCLLPLERLTEWEASMGSGRGDRNQE